MTCTLERVTRLERVAFLQQQQIDKLYVALAAQQRVIEALVPVEIEQPAPQSAPLTTLN
jgi:uncharacterized coiled-coil protein SlyX